MSNKRITALILAVLLMFSASICSFAAESDSELLAKATSTYSQALSLAGRSSFHGSCNLATAYQLKAMGVYSKELDYSGSGNLWYTYYKDRTTSTGGYKIITMGGKNCLSDLVDKYGDKLYNIVYSLGTGGTSGANHVLFISAIINGYVYFADSFNCQYGSTYVPEGHGTKLSLSSFVSSYKSMNGDAYGCVYFSNGNESAHTLEKQEDELYPLGIYKTTASLLNVRKGAGTSYASEGLIPENTEVEVTEVKDGWGKIAFANSTGWISLTYAELIEAADEIKIVTFKADKNYATVGSTVKWTTEVKNTKAEYTYQFTVMKDEKTVFTSAATSSNEFEYKTEEAGSYIAKVTVSDKDGNSAEQISASLACFDSADGLKLGDANMDGLITSADARIAIRIAASLETADDKVLVCTDVDGDGKITSADARIILRAAANLAKL